MKAKNERVIKQAFERLAGVKHYSMIGVLKSLLPNAVQFALDFHEMGPDPHGGHLESGGNYGWLIVYNGQEVAREIYTTSNNEGDVNEQLNEIISKVPNKGYVGIVMAGMRVPTYFSEDFERAVVEATIQFTEQNFFRYFKQI